MKADEEMPELSEAETNERLAQMEAALRARMRAANDGC
jgi:hypothetical protein